MSFWTPERVIELRELADEGYSASQAGFVLGTSKSAILSAAHRYGVQFDHDGKLRAKAPQTGKALRRAPLQYGRLKPLPAPPVAPAPAAAPPTPSRPCSLLELTDKTCRWVISGDGPPYVFCGALEADFPAIPYCRMHSRLAYRRPGEREEAA